MLYKVNDFNSPFNREENSSNYQWRNVFCSSARRSVTFTLQNRRWPFFSLSLISSSLTDFLPSKTDDDLFLALTRFFVGAQGPLKKSRALGSCLVCLCLKAALRTARSAPCGFSLPLVKTKSGKPGNAVDQVGVVSQRRVAYCCHTIS